MDNYSILKNFIKIVFVEQGIEINELDTTRDAIAAITNRFQELGWTVTKVKDEKSRFRKHRIESPDGQETLLMTGGKVYRHPSLTEQICRRKHLTKRMMDFAGLPMPAGADFAPVEKEVAAAFFTKMTKPVVVKPTDSGGSKGVTVGVSDLDQFAKAWAHALADERKASNVLVEQFIRGMELRAYVVGEKVVSIVARLQPFVVGDGSSSLQELVDGLHVEREKNYRAKKLPVKVDWDFVEGQSWSPTSVPEEDQIVLLNRFNNVTAGGFRLDVTNVVADDIKEIARKAKDAVPHLEIAGIDLIVGDLSDSSTAYVVEVNTAAALDSHRYPTHGAARAVEYDIVDYFHENWEKKRISN